MAKNSSELHQRAAAKRAPVLTAAVDEADEDVEQRLQTIPPPGLAAAPPDAVTFESAAGDKVVGKDKPARGVAATSDETPHVHEETDEAREARLDKQWKQLKVEVGDLPDVYARLSKFKLTGSVSSAKSLWSRANRKSR